MTAPALIVPRRLQRSRRAGWRMPDGAIYVGRGKGAYGRYGNPYSWENYQPFYRDDDGEQHRIPDAERRRMAVSDFDAGFRLGAFDLPDYPSIAQVIEDLGGRDLVCWCPLDGPCHGDVLLAVANPDLHLPPRPFG